MQTRKLGSSNLEVSEVGIGCWQLGGDFGPIDEKRACQVIEAALESGVTFFDTADVYGAGQSEKYLGKMLLDAPAEVKIGTKYGRAAGTYPDGYSLENMRDSVKYSQDRLQRHCIDLLQLHCIPPHFLQDGEVFEWLRVLVQEGHIASFGASVETIAEAQMCLAQDDIASLQIIFNLLRQRPKEDLFSEALEKNVGIVVRLPLASGVLTGKFTKQTRFDKSDHRNYNKDGQAFSVGETFSGIEFEKALAIASHLENRKPGSMTMAQFALRWILDHPAVSTIIPGASSVEQVKANVSASEIEPLSRGSHEELYDYYLRDIEPLIRCEI